MLDPPRLFVVEPGAAAEGVRDASRAGLSRLGGLPDNVRIQSLRPMALWPQKLPRAGASLPLTPAAAPVLLRLIHEATGDPKASSPVKVTFSMLFYGTNFSDAVETTISGNEQLSAGPVSAVELAPGTVRTFVGNFGSKLTFLRVN